MLQGLPEQLRSSCDSTIEVVEMVPRVSYLMIFPIWVKCGEKEEKSSSNKVLTGCS